MLIFIFNRHYVFVLLLIQYINVCFEFKELYAYNLTKCYNKDYKGKVNVAADGSQCLHWINHKSFYVPYWTNAEAKRNLNYCRNPSNDSRGPRCVVAPGVFKFCNVPKCGK